MLGAKSSLLHQVLFWALCNRGSAGKLQVLHFNPSSSCHRECKEQIVMKRDHIADPDPCLGGC